ncbi:MAG: hypothetical protein MZV63_50375 [Marinilabiliales bacterium]|nr:hypothetical protein [Marinilabiliales bacterium]
MLTEKDGLSSRKISSFDPNVLAIATGMEEHNNYAVDFIKATRMDQGKIFLMQGSAEG